MKFGMLSSLSLGDHLYVDYAKLLKNGHRDCRKQPALDKTYSPILYVMREQQAV